MAAATAPSSAVADPSPNSLSPRAARAARHPWSHVVRSEPDGSALPPPSSPPSIHSPDPSDRSPRKPLLEAAVPSSAVAAPGKKPAWKRPSNGLIEGGHVVIGGAASWPALSESSPAKSTSRLPSNPSDGPPVAVPQVPAISSSSLEANSNPSAITNVVAPERQISTKRGGTTTSCNVAPLTSAPLPQNTDKQMPRELSPRDQTRNITNFDHGPRGSGPGLQAHDGGDHHRRYGGNRRWNNGFGSGSHQNNYNNRRDQERGGYDGFRRNNRDIHMQHRGPRPYFRPPPPPVPPPFHLPQVQHFGNPMMFPDMQSPVFYVAAQPPPGSVPYMPHPVAPPQMYIPHFDVRRANLLKQIEFYFSEENLCRDVYLRKNMNKQGWVPISEIANFNRVQQMTKNIDANMTETNIIEFILNTMRLSTEVEVQGDKIRKRKDWMIWLLPPSTNQLGNISGQSSAASSADNSADNLAAHLQTVDLKRTSSQSSIGISNCSEVVSTSASASGSPSKVVVNCDSDDSRQRSD
ncbi:la-related protein 1C isoform X1 [Canna indica]|uniref:La-related protein 1C isoform X1 n=1 Tax=Canna indica TaxID=4628 RepID=A0AAQ3L096_9LILI|nr:la-related protein 1C isoform X1 [Canna indica]